MRKAHACRVSGGDDETENVSALQLNLPVQRIEWITSLDGLHAANVFHQCGAGTLLHVCAFQDRKYPTQANYTR